MTENCVACGDGADSADELQAIIEEKSQESSCPECGSVKFEHREGCNLCPECGYSGCK